MAGMERRAETRMDDLPESALRQLEFLRTLLHGPRLLLLDEPFAGMDTYERTVTQEILSGLAAEGVTIVLTSGKIQEILEFCHSIGVLGDGRMLAQGTREEIMGQIRASAPLYMEIRNGQEEAIRLLRNNPDVLSLTYDRNYFVIHYAGNQEQEAALLRRLIEAGIEVSSFHRGEGNPEELSRHLETGNGIPVNIGGNDAKEESGL
jgi:ABC-2 type transport system ATP-binding protein